MAEHEIPDRLSTTERQILLELARQSIHEAVCIGTLTPLDLAALPKRLREPGVTFITLTIGGVLRGCIGALEPYQSLAEDVREHAVAAALQDYRFYPIRPEELPEIEIEISRLTPTVRLDYDTPEELLTKLRPRVDGVLVCDGRRRATFLPQVWEKLPDPVEFLSHLCQKMNAPADLWQTKKLELSIYQVEEFQSGA